MDNDTNKEKEFGNDIDRLIAGEQPKVKETSGEDYEKTIKFANRMLESRIEPSPAFKENLRRRLLLKIVDQEMEIERKRESARGFWETVRNLIPPRSPAWRTVTATIAVFVVALVIVWRVGIFSGTTNPPIIGLPSPTTGIPQGPIEVTATAQQKSYELGDEVHVTFTFTNHGSETLTLTTFPPEVIIAAASLRPYRTIPGGASKTLAPGETTDYAFTWDQRDNEGQQVPPGNYVINMLDIELGSGKGIVTLPDSPQISIISP